MIGTRLSTGELRKHDGGVEDSKGMLAPAPALALALKRDCQCRAPIVVK